MYGGRRVLRVEGEIAVSLGGPRQNEEGAEEILTRTVWKDAVRYAIDVALVLELISVYPKGQIPT
jgi:hypothetical protein